MSMFGFNPSGFMGGGFNMDFSNFDFSAYAPKKEAVEDPVDIVSEKTPTPEVEVLEGAGTVAVTKQPEVKYSSAVQNAIAPTPDPIEQAIQSVKPTLDLGISVPSGVSDYQEELQETKETQKVDETSQILGQGGFSGFDVVTPAQTQPTSEFDVMGNAAQAIAQQNEQQAVTAEQTLEGIVTGLSPQIEQLGNYSDLFVTGNTNPEKQELMALATSMEKGGVNRSQPFLADKDKIDEINNTLASEAFQDLDTKYTQQLSDNFGTAEFLRKEATELLGLPAGYNVITDKYGSGKYYQYNRDTNQYEVQSEWDNSPNEVKAVADAAVMAGAMYLTGGAISNALSNSTAVTSVVGGNTAAANALGQAAASGISTAIQGGDTGDILKSAALGGISGYTKGLNNLTSDAEYMMELSGSEALELKATADLANTVNDTVNLVKAVDEKDVLGVVNGAISVMGGGDSIQELAADKIQETFDTSTFVNINADALGELAVNAVVEVAEGGSVEDVVVSTANQAIKTIVLSEDNVSSVISDVGGESDYVKNNLNALTKTAIEVGEGLVDGNNKEEIIGKAVTTYVKEGGQILPQGTGTDFTNPLEAAEDWYHENIEDPLEEFWQEIEPQREAVEQAVQATVDYVDAKVVQPTVETVKTIVKEADSAVRALPTTKEDWEELEDDAKELASDAATVVRETGRDIRDAVAPVTETVRETGRAIEEGYGVAEDFVKEEVAPAVNQIGRDIRDALPDSQDSPDISLPSENPFSITGEPELTKERRGFYYDDSGLVRNPFLYGGESERIRSLTEMIEMEQEAARQAAVLADDEERKLRYKSVFGVNPNIKVKYNG